MRKTLDFKVPFLPDWGGGFAFIECFVPAYIHIENIDISGIKDYPCPPRNGRAPCHGCGNIRKGKCENAELNKVSPYHMMLGTMSGGHSLRRSYDGQPTEMEKIINSIDYTVDFYFGFTGYEYRKCSDNISFKKEIIASINAGKPVIAETNASKSSFHLITGYDGDMLAYPSDDYFYKRACPNGAPAYNEIAALYIFGDKITPRYTLIDGLKNIRKVIEYTVNEKLWDDYLVKMGGWDEYPSNDGLDKADMAEKKVRMKRMLDTIRYSMNAHCVQKAFQDIHIRHEEMLDPKLSGLWESIKSNSFYMGHGIENKIDRINWETIRPATFRGISKEICEGILKFKEADIKLLDYLNQAIEILDNLRK